MEEKRAAPCAAWAFVLGLLSYQILDRNLMDFQFGDRLLTFPHALAGLAGVILLVAALALALLWLHRLPVEREWHRRLAAAALVVVFSLFGGVHIYKLTARLLPGSPYASGRLEDIAARFTGGTPQRKPTAPTILMGEQKCGFSTDEAWIIVKDWQLTSYYFGSLPKESRPALPRISLQFTQPKYGTELTLSFDRNENPRLVSLCLDNTHDSAANFYTYYADAPESDLLALEELLRTAPEEHP